jgi:hypothetical protein
MKVVETLYPEKQQFFKLNCPFASMVAICINDLAGGTQCENFVTCSFVINMSTDGRDIAQVAFLC